MIRKVTRRGKPILGVDIHYRKPDGSFARYRHDAQVQTMAAATAEERRLFANIAQFGDVSEPQATDTEICEHGEPTCTFGEAVDAFKAGKAITKLKPSTRVGYEEIFGPASRIASVRSRLKRSATSRSRSSTLRWSRRGSRPRDAGTSSSASVLCCVRRTTQGGSTRCRSSPRCRRRGRRSSSLSRTSRWRSSSKPRSPLGDSRSPWRRARAQGRGGEVR